MVRAAFLLLTAILAFGAPAEAITGRATITGITFSDSGRGASTTIDVVQNLDCNRDGSVTTTDQEEFSDTQITVGVNNDRTRSLRVTRLWYRLRVGSRVFNSRKIAIAGGGTVAAGKSGQVVTLFAHAQSGLKFFIRSAAPISSDLGVRNITVYLSGDDGAGHTVTLHGATVADFTDSDNC